VQKSVLLSLVEMSRRPDVASPSARLQYFLRLNNRSYYYDFSSKDISGIAGMSFVKGLEYLLVNFDKSKSLVHLTDTFENIVPTNINVSRELENFLSTNKTELGKNEQLLETFFKGDDILTRHESFKRANLKKLISTYNNSKYSDDKLYETPNSPLKNVESGNSSTALKCNIDINKELLSREEQALNDSTKSHYFALQEGSNLFIAVSSSHVQKPFKNYDSSYFIKQNASTATAPVCQFNNKLKDIILMSTTGKNPAQHLKHLISYDIDQSYSYQSLGELLNFSRHLFLNSPDRILYESKKGRKSQLEYFLTMNFPIYHVDTLGNIIGSALFKNGPKEDSSLFTDERSQATLWCAP
jgi:hypothetical protein